MHKHTSLTPFELELQAMLDLPEPDASFVQGLRTTLQGTPAPVPAQKKPGSRWIPGKWNGVQPGWAWVAAAILLTVLALFLAAGPQRVLAEARRILGGFIPGVGFVDNASRLRILEKPVQIRLEGAAIAVEKAYTNTAETAIQIHYLDDSRTCKATDTTQKENRSRLDQAVYLLLPDGQKLFALTPRFSNWGKFPPLPDGVNEVVLVLPPDVIYPCATGDPFNKAGETAFCQCLDEGLRWLIQLKFVPPSAGSLLPLVDNSTSTPLPAAASATQPAAHILPSQAPQTATPLAGAQPELVGKLVALDDGYLFLAALKRDSNGHIFYSFGLNERRFQLFDATGSEFPLEEVDRSQVNPDVLKDFQWGDTILLRVHTKNMTAPFKLTFPALVQSQSQFGKEAEFTLDLGVNPQPGQRIPVQKSFDFIPGYPFTLKEAAIDSLTTDGLGITLFFAGKGYETILVNPVPFPDPPPQGGSSGPCADFPDCFYTSTGFTPNPDNHYRLAVSGVDHAIQGPWSLSFEP
jgi:hypothetical protein